MLKYTIAWLRKVFLELRESPPLHLTKERPKYNTRYKLIYTEVYSHERHFIFPNYKGMSWTRWEDLRSWFWMTRWHEFPLAEHPERHLKIPPLHLSLYWGFRECIGVANKFTPKWYLQILIDVDILGDKAQDNPIKDNDDSEVGCVCVCVSDVPVVFLYGRNPKVWSMCEFC